ncbi:MAG: MarR family transcriptional regulator [Propionicimonas sp.]
MTQRLTATLHELVFAMDAYADRVLTRRFGVDRNLLAFLSPLAATTLDVTRLAEFLNLTKAAVSKRVPVLERQGWVAVSSDPGHGRRVMVSLTPQGSTLVSEAGELLNRRFAALLDTETIDADRLNEQLHALISAVRALPSEEDL